MFFLPQRVDACFVYYARSKSQILYNAEPIIKASSTPLLSPPPALLPTPLALAFVTAIFHENMDKVRRNVSLKENVWFPLIYYSILCIYC